MPDRRPEIELVTPAASPEEAAAAIVAVERFLRDHAPAAVESPEPESAWLRTARLEGVDREPHVLPWG